MLVAAARLVPGRVKRAVVHLEGLRLALAPVLVGLAETAGTDQCMSFGSDLPAAVLCSMAVEVLAIGYTPDTAAVVLELDTATVVGLGSMRWIAGTDKVDRAGIVRLHLVSGSKDPWKWNTGCLHPALAVGSMTDDVPDGGCSL